MQQAAFKMISELNDPARIASLGAEVNQIEDDDQKYNIIEATLEEAQGSEDADVDKILLWIEEALQVS